MFILRTFNREDKQSNLILGLSYNLVMMVDDDFKELIKSYPDTKEIYAFLVYNDGSAIRPLYMEQRNYIMTSDGKTFTNLSWK